MRKAPDNLGHSLQMYWRRMPHVSTTYAIYFVTWRLNKAAVPLEHNERTLIADALNHFHGYRYWLVSYVVMDDHVHVIVRLTPELPLQKAVQNWKSFTSHQIKKVSNREGPLWQPEYYDRIIRNEEELLTTIRYVVNNPAKRWPEIEEYLWCKVFDL